MNHFNKLFEICERFAQLSYFIYKNAGGRASSNTGGDKPKVPLELRFLIYDYLNRKN